MSPTSSPCLRSCCILSVSVLICLETSTTPCRSRREERKEEKSARTARASGEEEDSLEE